MKETNNDKRPINKTAPQPIDGVEIDHLIQLLRGVCGRDIKLSIVTYENQPYLDGVEVIHWIKENNEVPSQGTLKVETEDQPDNYFG